MAISVPLSHLNEWDTPECDIPQSVATEMGILPSWPIERLTLPTKTAVETPQDTGIHVDTDFEVYGEMHKSAQTMASGSFW